MKKKGFTLVELLAVIAILAILVIIAMPNVLEMFNKAKQDSFETEIKTIISTTNKQWLSDSIASSSGGHIVYCRINGVDCDNALKLDGNTEIDYYVEVDSQGHIVLMGATNNEHQFSSEKDGLKVEDEINSDNVSDLSQEEIIEITEDGIIIDGNILGAPVPIHVKTADELVAAVNSNLGVTIILDNDISGYSQIIKYDSVIDLNGKKLDINGIRLDANVTIKNGEIITDYNSALIEIRPNSNHTFTFDNVIFTNLYKRNNNPTDRLEIMVKVVPETAGIKTKYTFKNCTFNNATVNFNGLSDKITNIDVTFENNTFNALAASDKLIDIGSYFNGVFVVSNNTFDVKCTKPNYVAFSAKDYSTSSLTITVSNNKFIANQATAYTYDSSKGETAADSVNLANNIRNCCLIDYRYYNGGYVIVNETGTVISGDVAIESRR